MGGNQAFQTPCGKIPLEELSELRSNRVVAVAIDGLTCEMVSIMHQLVLNILTARVKLVVLRPLRCREIYIAHIAIPLQTRPTTDNILP